MIMEAAALWQPEVFSAADLDRMEIPDPRFLVDGLIPSGVALLAGRPKAGKSWWLLDAGLQLATGGTVMGTIGVDSVEVLYLALEDTKRRLRRRLRKLCPDGLPPKLKLATEWRCIADGGAKSLAAYLSLYPSIRMVMIDTLHVFRGPKRTKDVYAEDYAAMRAIKAVSDERDVPIIVATHVRKMFAADPVEEVGGTFGLTGAADTILVIRRIRGQTAAALHVTGRDVEEQELAVEFEPESCRWKMIGDGQAVQSLGMSAERRAIIAYLDKHGPAQPKDVADGLGKKPGAVRKTMAAMAKDDQMDVVGGVYALKHGNSGNTVTPLG